MHCKIDARSISVVREEAEPGEFESRTLIVAVWACACVCLLGQAGELLRLSLHVSACVQERVCTGLGLLC